METPGRRPPLHPSPRTHRAHRAATWPRRRRASAAPQPRSCAGPLPLSSQQVQQLFPLSTPRVSPLLMVSFAGSLPPLPRTRSNFHRLSGLPIVVSTGRQAGDWARHRGAIAERKERPGHPPLTPAGIRESAGTEPTRCAPPPSQSTHAQSADPAPSRARRRWGPLPLFLVKE